MDRIFEIAVILAIPADTTALRGTVVAHIDFAGIPALSGIGTMSNLTGLVILAAPTNPGNATLECTLAPILDIGWRGVSQLAITWRVFAKCSKKGCPIQLFFGSRLEIRQETRVPELHPGLIRELAWLGRGRPARRRNRASGKPNSVQHPCVQSEVGLLLRLWVTELGRRRGKRSTQRSLVRGSLA